MMHSRYRGCFNTRISSGLGTTNSSSSFFLNCRILIVVVVVVVGNDKQFPLLNKSSVSRVGIIFAKKFSVLTSYFFCKELEPCSCR